MATPTLTVSVAIFSRLPYSVRKGAEDLKQVKPSSLTRLRPLFVVNLPSCELRGRRMNCRVFFSVLCYVCPTFSSLFYFFYMLCSLWTYASILSVFSSLSYVYSAFVFSLLKLSPQLLLYTLAVLFCVFC